MTTNDGGPAFPRPASIGNDYVTGESGVVVDPQMGMSLRDWFAGQALGHLLQPVIAAMHQGHPAPSSADVAKICYQLADAMLKARRQ
jgi:hypothetical protein